MALAALVISIIALVVAGVSAWYTRSQANATLEATRTDRERHHFERTPHFESEFEWVNGGAIYRLWLTLTAGVSLDGISVTIPPSSGMRFAPGQSGVRVDSDRLSSDSYDGEILVGGRVGWRVELDENEYVESVQLRVNSRRGSEAWTRRVIVRPPFTGLSVY